MRLQTKSPYSSTLSLSSSLPLLLPVVALAAFALFPTIARAESSSDQVYHLAPPTLESKGPESAVESEAPYKNRPKAPTTPETPASATPRAGEGAIEEAPTARGDESGSTERHKQPAVSAGESGNYPSGGSGSGSSGASGESPGVTTLTKPESSGDDGSGGSSPVLPIVIAVVVLAAISIGVVLYRERRRGTGRPDSDPSSG
jgi:cobalamin biosynthesis Mg chelatase CobN